jgi:hypothetical protein
MPDSVCLVRFIAICCPAKKLKQIESCQGTFLKLDGEEEEEEEEEW